MNERCDQKDCPAEGVFRISTWHGPLFFCGHHEREYAPDLMADGFVVTRTGVGAAL